MTFEVEIGGRTRTVAIEPTDRPGRFRVTVHREPCLVDVSRTGDFGLSLLIAPAERPFSAPQSPQTVTVPLAGAASVSADLHLTPTDGYGELLVNLQGRTAIVTVNGRRRRHGPDAGTHGFGQISITAPMPGRVVRVLVTPGDEIAARQGVVVVEAMKMENELRAPRAGRVKEVAVAAGTSVEAGRVLAVIE